MTQENRNQKFKGCKDGEVYHGELVTNTLVGFILVIFSTHYPPPTPPPFCCGKNRSSKNAALEECVIFFFLGDNDKNLGESFASRHE